MAISPKIGIIIVDDQSSSRSSVKEILKDSGFKNLKDFESGPDTLKYLTEAEAQGEPVDLIISDYDMPGMDGTQLFQEIKDHPTFSGTKFILISGCADQSFIVKAVQLGIRSILLKPFSKQDLINELAKLLN